jgi:CRP-like cAMP-binding protein
MVPFEDLKKIYLMQRLTDPMLEAVQPLVEKRSFENRDVIFKEGQNADLFFMLFKGKVLLEVEASEAMMISLGSIKSGFSFGWSALVQGSDSYTTFAMCVEPCEVFMVQGEKLLGLMEKDHSMGFMIMTGVVNILKKRLERRTDQFLKTLRKHPDIQKPWWT